MTDRIDHREPHRITWSARTYRSLNNAVIREYGDDLAVLAEKSPTTVYELLEEQYMKILLGLGNTSYDAYTGVSVDGSLDGEEARRALIKSSLGGNALPKIEDEELNIIVNVLERRRLRDVLHKRGPRIVQALEFTVPPS